MYIKVPFIHQGSIGCNKFLVIQLQLKQESRHLLEIFSTCLYSVCANLARKFWPYLNQPASHGPFRPKLWTALGTVFVEIFQPHGWSFQYLLRNGVLKFFTQPRCPPSRCPRTNCLFKTVYQIMLKPLVFMHAQNSIISVAQEHIRTLRTGPDKVFGKSY